jgi:hypothetical protein
VPQEVNNKVGDLTTLYNFYKGRMRFFSTICAQNACQFGCFHGADEQCQTTLITVFHPFTLQISNATQHESCVPRKTTTFVLGEFEVFRQNLENATKVPDDIGGSKGVYGVFD